MLSTLFSRVGDGVGVTGCGMVTGVTSIVTANISNVASLVMPILDAAKSNNNTIVLVHIGALPTKARDSIAKIPNLELIHLVTAHEAAVLGVCNQLMGPKVGTASTAKELHEALSSLKAPSSFALIDEFITSLQWKSEFDPLTTDERSMVQASLNLALAWKQHSVLAALGNPGFLEASVAEEIEASAFVRGGLPALSPKGMKQLGPAVQKSSTFSRHIESLRKVLEKSSLVHETNDYLVTSGPSLTSIYAKGGNEINKAWRAAVASTDEAFKSYCEILSTPADLSEQRQKIVICPVRRHETNVTSTGNGKSMLSLGGDGVFLSSTCSKVVRSMRRLYVPRLNRQAQLTLQQAALQAALKALEFAVTDQVNLGRSPELWASRGVLGGLTIREGEVLRLITFGAIRMLVAEELIRASLNADAFPEVVWPNWVVLNQIYEGEPIQSKPSILDEMVPRCWRMGEREKQTVTFTSSFDKLIGVTVQVYKFAGRLLLKRA
jgi:hypothetical protein